MKDGRKSTRTYSYPGLTYNYTSHKCTQLKKLTNMSECTSPSGISSNMNIFLISFTMFEVTDGKLRIRSEIIKIFRFTIPNLSVYITFFYSINTFSLKKNLANWWSVSCTQVVAKQNTIPSWSQKTRSFLKKHLIWTKKLNLFFIFQRDMCKICIKIC